MHSKLVWSIESCSRSRSRRSHSSGHANGACGCRSLESAHQYWYTWHLTRSEKLQLPALINMHYLIKYCWPTELKTRVNIWAKYGKLGLKLSIYKNVKIAYNMHLQAIDEDADLTACLTAAPIQSNWLAKGGEASWWAAASCCTLTVCACLSSI